MNLRARVELLDELLRLAEAVQKRPHSAGLIYRDKLAALAASPGLALCSSARALFTALQCCAEERTSARAAHWVRVIEQLVPLAQADVIAFRQQAAGELFEADAGEPYRRRG